MLRVFSGKTPITLSGGFSVEILTGVTPLWKTKLNRSIPVIEDGIPRGLQHCHKTCCEKDGYHRRWAYMIQRWFHCGDVVSGQVDLHMTTLYYTSDSILFLKYVALIWKLYK